MNKKTQEPKKDLNKMWRPEPEIGMGSGNREHDVVDDDFKIEGNATLQNRHGVSLPNENRKKKSVLGNQDGAMGYVLAWLLGVPASVLFVIFLLRGH